MQNLYSIRMRAAQGGAHEDGGRHISGAEDIHNHSTGSCPRRDYSGRA